MVDDDIVAVAAAGPARHLHIAAGGCIDGRAARGGKVGTGVELVDPRNGVLAPAVLTGNAAITLERADEAGKAQGGLGGSGRSDHLLDLLLDGLIVHLVRFNGGLRVLLGLLCLGSAHLGGGHAGVELVLLGTHLAVLGIQICLFALQLAALGFQRQLIAFQRFLGVLHVVQDLGVLDGDVLHDLVEGQQLIQVVHRRQHGNAATVPQLLHGSHVLLEIPPLVGDLRFFFGDLLLLDGDLLFLQADAVLHLGDLTLQHADLALDHRDLFLQLRFQRLGGLLLLFGIGQFLFVLYNGLGELIQLVLQRTHAGGRAGRIDRHAQHKAGRRHKGAGSTHHDRVAGGLCVAG